MNTRLRALYTSLLIALTCTITPAYSLPQDGDENEGDNSAIVASIDSFNQNFTVGSAFDQVVDLKLTVTVDIPSVLVKPLVIAAEDVEKQRVEVVSTADGQLPVILKTVDAGSCFTLLVGDKFFDYDKKHDTPRVWTLDEYYSASEDLFMLCPTLDMSCCGDDGKCGGDGNCGDGECCGGEGCEDGDADCCQVDCCENGCCGGEGCDDCGTEYSPAGMLAQMAASNLREATRPAMLEFCGAFKYLVALSDAAEVQEALTERGINLNWNVTRAENTLNSTVSVSADKIATQGPEAIMILGEVLEGLQELGVELDFSALEQMENLQDMAGLVTASVQVDGRWNQDVGLHYELSADASVIFDLSLNGDYFGQIVVQLSGLSTSQFCECGQ